MTTAIINILINDSTVSGLVGTAASAKVKVYPLYCPKPEDNPFITVRTVGMSYREECRGSDVMEYTYVYEVTSCAKNFKAVLDISRAVSDALYFYNTDVDDVTYKSTDVVGYAENYVDDVGVYTVTQRFQIVQVATA